MAEGKKAVGPLDSGVSSSAHAQDGEIGSRNFASGAGDSCLVRSLKWLSRERLRLLYLPNEHIIGVQRGPRLAFEGLLEDGLLGGYQAYALDAESRLRGGVDVAIAEMLSIADELRPHIVLLDHIADFPLGARRIDELHGLSPRPVIALRELDAWGWLRKPLPRTTRQVARRADVVYLCGLGGLRRIFRAAGARDIRLCTHGFDETRFGTPWEVTTERPFDVAMLANRVTSRLPGRRLPGARARERLAGELHRRFGERFALFGDNWERYPFDRGPVPHDEQDGANRSAFVTVGWDHFPRTPFYFSNRIPVALASGVPHVTNYQPGYEELFPDGCGLLWGRSVREVADKVSALLDRPRSELVDLGIEAGKFARRRFSEQSRDRAVVAELAQLREERERRPSR
jgi:hypothetical protein